MKKQRGATLLGFVFVGLLLIFAVVMALKIAPAYIEYFALKTALHDVANEPALLNASTLEIRTAFGKRADAAGIKSITAEDLEIRTGSNGIELEAKYGVKEHLFANVSVYLDFDVKAAK